MRTPQPTPDGVYGVAWLVEILRSCGKPTTKDVAFFTTMLWINQMLPNAAGRVMYVRVWEPRTCLRSSRSSTAKARI